MNLKQIISKLSKEEYKYLKKKITEECIFKEDIVEIVRKYSYKTSSGGRKIPGEVVEDCLQDILKLVEK